MLLVATAVPFAVAVTEVALRSPSADVTFTFAVEVLFATVIVPKVGADVSTSTVYAGLTVVFALLSVVLNCTVFRPATRTIGTVHARLWSVAVVTDCQPPVPTLYPIVEIVVESEPDVAFAIPLKVTNAVLL